MHHEYLSRLSCQVESYDLIVVGHLRWNRYFGESAANPPRGQPSTCTSTLVCRHRRPGLSLSPARGPHPA